MSTRSLRPILALFLPFLGSCSGGSNDEAQAQARAKMASDLVECQNEKSNLKDQISELRAEVAKLKVAADQTQQLDPIDVKAGGEKRPMAHREGNIPPDAAVKVLQSNAPSLRACYE